MPWPPKILRNTSHSRPPGGRWPSRTIREHKLYRAYGSFEAAKRGAWEVWDALLRVDPNIYGPPHLLTAPVEARPHTIYLLESVAGRFEERNFGSRVRYVYKEVAVEKIYVEEKRERAPSGHGVA
jgi:hypothetical protein